MKSLIEYIKESVTNHLTPIENILMNIKNLYCQEMGIVAELDSTGKVIVLTSSKFVDYNITQSIMYTAKDAPYNGVTYQPSLSLYIEQQGLDKIEIVQSGEEFRVLCYASDIEKIPQTNVDAKIY